MLADRTVHPATTPPAGAHRTTRPLTRNKDYLVSVAVELLKIGELAKRSGVSVATIKYYLREGLLAPTKKSGRTMSWYDAAPVHRIRAIKELQQQQFLPLDVIRDSLEQNAEAPDDVAAAEAIAGVLSRHHGTRTRTRAELIARGVSPRQLDLLAAAGLAVPSGPEQRYTGDDLAILSTLGAARQAGLTAEMLPFEIINDYLAALRALVAVELRLFRGGVLRRARGAEAKRLTAEAATLSERFVVLVRRKLLLPTPKDLIEEETHVTPSSSAAGSGRRVRRQRQQPRRRGAHGR